MNPGRRREDAGNLCTRTEVDVTSGQRRYGNRRAYPINPRHLEGCRSVIDAWLVGVDARRQHRHADPEQVSDRDHAIVVVRRMSPQTRAPIGLVVEFQHRCAGCDARASTAAAAAAAADPVAVGAGTGDGAAYNREDKLGSSRQRPDASCHPGLWAAQRLLTVITSRDRAARSELVRYFLGWAAAGL